MVKGHLKWLTPQDESPVRVRVRDQTVLGFFTNHSFYVFQTKTKVYLLTSKPFKKRKKANENNS